MAKSKPYPAWICHSCGMKYGKWYEGGEYIGPKHHCATMHYDSCDLCGANDVPVTEPRDYGYLIDGWDNKGIYIGSTNASAVIQ